MVSQMCPDCGTKNEAKDSMAGCATSCSKCGALIRFPAAMKKVAPPTNLMTCPGCAKPVSRQAAACPNCGQPIATPPAVGSGGNVLAAALSFFIPGLGQLTQGRVVESLLFFFAVGVLGFFTAFVSNGLKLTDIGLLLALALGSVYIWNVVDAARWSPR